MNDPRTPFGKRAAELTRIKPDNLEKPIGQRLTEFRATEVAGEGNAFDRAAKPKPVIVQKATSPRTQSGLLEDETLTAARAAEEQRRAAIKAEKAKAPYLLPDPMTLKAILVGWYSDHDDPSKANYFFRSEWNVNQLVRGVRQNAEAGNCGWDYPAFEAVFNLLQKRGGLESPSRHRGSNPPVEVYPENRTLPEQPVVRQITVLTAEEQAAIRAEEQAARAVPFDELAQSVRGTYKK